MNGVAQSKILLLLLGFFSASEEEGKDCSLFFLALVQMLAVYHDKRVEEGGVELVKHHNTMHTHGGYFISTCPLEWHGSDQGPLGPSWAGFGVYYQLQCGSAPSLNLGKVLHQYFPKNCPNIFYQNPLL